jgi:hypothetical protein
LSKSPQDQERFQRPPNCKLTPMMKDMNDWLFIRTDLVQAHSDSAKSQINMVLQHSLDLHVASMSTAVKSGNFGVISSNDDEGYWLVKWTGPPHQLTMESFVEGGNVAMPIGTWVCEAEWYRRVPYAAQWYERYNNNGEKHLYRLQLVASPEVAVERFNQKTRMTPPATAKHEYNTAQAKANVKYIPSNEKTLIKRTLRRLEKLKLLPLNGELEDPSDEDNDEDLESDDDAPNDLEEEEDNDKEEDNEDDEDNKQD